MTDEKLNEHTLEFEHFKLHADSTLKTYTKERLIRYIHMLYDNWSATDIWTARLLDVNTELDKGLNKICKRQANSLFCHGNNISSDKCYDKNKCAQCWKEWCMKNE